MTAPDSRDSVERIVAEMREMADWPHATADRMDLFRWADRLSALPQQAGGEDAKDAARYRRIRNGPHSDRHGDLYAMAFMPDGDEPLDGAGLDAAVDRVLARDAAIGGTGDA